MTSNSEFPEKMISSYGEFIQSSKLQSLDESNVPSTLRPYIPYARLWGVTDDLEREELVGLAPDSAKRDLQRIIDAIDDELDDWLAGPEADAELSAEYLAFSAMRMSADFM